jgi:hypothetical protein
MYICLQDLKKSTPDTIEELLEIDGEKIRKFLKNEEVNYGTMLEGTCRLQKRKIEKAKK